MLSWGPLRLPILMALSPQAQQETQKAALRYERAVSMHNAAREMVFVAEQGVMADKNRLDPTWQEMLNHATCKVGWLCLLVPRGPLLPRCPCTCPLLSYLLLSSLPSVAAVSGTACPFSALFGPLSLCLQIGEQPKHFICIGLSGSTANFCFQNILPFVLLSSATVP